MDNEEIQTNAQNNNKDSKENPDTINRLCRFAFIMSTIGVLTIGICPAFGVMGIVVGAIFKSKNFPLSDLNEDRVKKSKISRNCIAFSFCNRYCNSCSIFAEN